MFNVVVVPLIVKSPVTTTLPPILAVPPKYKSLNLAAEVPKSIALSLAAPPLGLSGNILSTPASKNKPTSPLPTTKPADLVPRLPIVAPSFLNTAISPSLPVLFKNETVP